jgi:hypothetical protein
MHTISACCGSGKQMTAPERENKRASSPTSVFISGEFGGGMKFELHRATTTPRDVSARNTAKPGAADASSNAGWARGENNDGSAEGD